MIHETATVPKFENDTVIFGRYKRLHLVGVGGAGMSGMAEILNNLGYAVTGSDNSPSEITEHLEELGITVHKGHAGVNLGEADVVVISSAVSEDNPEVVEANRRGIPIIKRAEMLGELMRLKFSIGIAGTHGKTTTTSMIGKILTDANLDPTVIVGGVVMGKGTGASLGKGQYMVAEADEYDRSFLKMFPSVAVVLNIEPDHLECYDDLAHLENSFLEYMNRTPFYGEVVFCADDPALTRLAPRIKRSKATFGLNENADYRAVDITSGQGRSRFGVMNKGEMLGYLDIRVPGRHNVLNALAATATAIELEIPFEIVADSLREFGGVVRRFEIKGLVDDIMVVDDYAHHPTELKATLSTAKDYYDRRVIAVFQPHLYSRTRQFYREFAEVLQLADMAFVVDIYPAREKPLPGVTSKMIAEWAEEKKMKKIGYLGAWERAVDKIVGLARPGDMIINIGAGSIYRINPIILQKLSER